MRRVDDVVDKYIIIGDKKFLDFSTHNPIGLRDNQQVKKVLKDSIDKFSLNSDINMRLPKSVKIYNQLSQTIAKRKNKSKAIIYSPGYNINISLLSYLFSTNDLILSDQLNSINIIEGIHLSGAKMVRYKNNDIDDLKEKLDKYQNDYKQIAVITESIFPINGLKAKLREIANLKEQYNFLFLVDESYGDGLYGPDGAGVASEQEVLEKIDFNMGYFSKNYSIPGEYLAINKDMENLLLQGSLRKNLIKKSGIESYLVLCLIEAFGILKDENDRVEKLFDNSRKLRKACLKMGYDAVICDTHIITLLFKEDKQVLDLAKILYDNGIIVSITIGKSTIKPRLRFFISSLFEDEDIDKIIGILGKTGLSVEENKDNEDIEFDENLEMEIDIDSLLEDDSSAILQTEDLED